MSSRDVMMVAFGASLASAWYNFDGGRTTAGFIMVALAAFLVIAIDCESRMRRRP
jgi:hypothetical protein